MPLLRKPNGRPPLMVMGVTRRELKSTFKGFKQGATAAWKVPTVDLLLAFGAEEAGNLITAAKLTAATIGTDTGAWTVNSGGAALTHTRVTTTPISRRCALRCGGTDYVSGYGYQIDMTGRSGATGWESFQRGFQSGRFGVSMTALFKYEALQPGTDDIGLDTFLFQGTGGGYAVAQQAIPYTDSPPGTLAAHGQVGAVSGKGQKIPIPNNTGFFEVHLKYDYAASMARVALVDATTGVLIGTSEYPTDPQELFNLQFQDYLVSYGGKITAGMIGVDYTTQAYPIGDVSVPVPTAVSVMQIGSAVGVLFSTLTNLAQIERNSGSGWSTLTSTFPTLNGANTFFDATATVGVSYQYRVTSVLGTQQSASVPTGSIVPYSLAYTSIATDPFTRADAGNLGVNWNEIVAGFQVVSNQASATLTDGLAVVEYNAVTPPSDARASITFRTTPTVNTPLAIYMRYNGGTDDGYYMELIGSALSIKKNTAGVTSVKASGTVSFAIGDVISWEPFGSGLAIYKNGTVVLGAFDPSFTTASVVTIVLNTIGTQTFAFDDFLLESVAVGSSPIAGTLAVTEANDTSSAAGALAIAATLSQTEAADTNSGAGVLALQGSATPSESADTLNAQGGATAITGTLAVTEAADTSAGSATLPGSGSLGITEAADSVSGASVLPIGGNSSQTESADTVSAAAALALQGTLARTEAGDTSAAAGSLPGNGTASPAEANDTLSADGTSISAGSGTLVVTEAADVSSGAGSLPIVASLALSEANDAATSLGALLIQGVTVINEAADSATALSRLAIQGTAAAIEADDAAAIDAVLLIAGVAALVEAPDLASAQSAGSIAGKFSATVTAPPNPSATLSRPATPAAVLTLPV